MVIERGIYVLMNHVCKCNFRFVDLSGTNVSEAISSSMAMSKAHLDSALPDLVRELGYQVENTIIFYYFVY